MSSENETSNYNVINFVLPVKLALLFIALLFGIVQAGNETLTVFSAAQNSEPRLNTEAASVTSLVNAANPIRITKSPGEQTVNTGESATFTIVVRNDGEKLLSNIAIADPVTPDCARQAGTLSSLSQFESHSYTCQTGPLFRDMTNEATVTANLPSGLQVTASAKAFVAVVSPDIEISKTPDQQQIFEGGIAFFTITITNIGQNFLTNLGVDDAETPGCSRAAGFGQLPDLQAGASTTYTCQTEPLFVDITNVATVTADIVEGPTVTASDSAFVEVVPLLEITKSPAEQTINLGSSAAFTITLINNSDFLLPDVTVSDPSTPDCARSVGDLSSQASTSYTCQTGSLFANLTNTASVTATLPEGSASSSATAFVFVVIPSIEISKSPAAQLVDPGDTASFTIKITNPDSDTKTNVVVTDPLTPDCGRQAGALPDLGPGEFVSYHCQTAPLFADLRNIAVVTADPPTGSSVTASSSALVNVLNPIEIIKSPARQSILAGSAVTFTIQVINDNDTTLTNVVVSDPLTPDCDLPATTLGPRSSISYTCQTGVLTEDLTNVATVAADSPSGSVTASDSAEVTVLQLSDTLVVSKSASPGTIVAPSGLVTFTIRVDNIGITDSTVTLNSLTDDIYGSLDGQGSCAVPQTIPIAGFYRCRFNVTISGKAGDRETNTVTAVAEDEAQNILEAQDSATVKIASPFTYLPLILHDATVASD